MSRLGPVQLSAYGLPALPMALVGIPLYLYIPQYYADELGLGLATVGLVLLLARTWDLVSDPLAGMLCDRLHLFGSHRRSWMWLGAPLLLLGAAGLFLADGPATAGDLLWSTLVLYTGWTLMAIPYQAWGAELSNDYHQRSRITLYREFFVVLGTLVAPLAFFFGADGLDDTGRVLQWLFTGLLLLVPLTLLFSSLLVPERRHQRHTSDWRQRWQALRENRPFRRLLSAFLLNGLANALPATLFLLFVARVLQDEASAGVLLMIYFCSGLAGIPLWLWAARRVEKHRLWCISMIWAALCFAWVPTLSPGDTTAFMVICILTGFSLGADMALPSAIQADVVDLDRQRSGTHRPGLFFGFWGMATKLSLALAVGLAFPLLELAGLQHNPPSPAGVLTLAWLYGGAPVVIKLGAVALMWRFPLGQAEQESIVGRNEDGQAITAAGGTDPGGTRRTTHLDRVQHSEA